MLNSSPLRFSPSADINNINFEGPNNGFSQHRTKDVVRGFYPLIVLASNFQCPYRVSRATTGVLVARGSWY